MSECVYVLTCQARAPKQRGPTRPDQLQTKQATDGNVADFRCLHCILQLRRSALVVLVSEGVMAAATAGIVLLRVLMPSFDVRGFAAVVAAAAAAASRLGLPKPLRASFRSA